MEDQKTTLEILEQAIQNYTGDCGPVTWEANGGENTVLLIGTYQDKDLSCTNYYGDEPWEQWGGDSIIEDSKLVWVSSGVDSYQDNGLKMVQQWTELKQL